MKVIYYWKFNKIPLRASNLSLHQVAKSTRSDQRSKIQLKNFTNLCYHNMLFFCNHVLLSKGNRKKNSTNSVGNQIRSGREFLTIFKIVCNFDYETEYF